MNNPISVRLDAQTRSLLENDARLHGYGLATYLRHLADERARLLRRDRIRAESQRVGEYLRDNGSVESLYDDVGNSMPVIE